MVLGFIRKKYVAEIDPDSGVVVGAIPEGESI